ncbi:MAG: DoxX family protein [Polyangiaceae bacterium]
MTDPERGGGRSDQRRETVRKALRALLGVAMIGVGSLHFLSPSPFVNMMPSALPAPLALVYVSGVAEIAGGAGLFVPRLRRAASYGLVALYIAVFPANVNMAIHHLSLGDYQPSTFALWARLPLQFVFIAWALWVGKPSREEN